MPQDDLGIFLVWQPSRGLCTDWIVLVFCVLTACSCTPLVGPAVCLWERGAFLAWLLHWLSATDNPGPVLPGCSSFVIGKNGQSSFSLLPLGGQVARFYEHLWTNWPLRAILACAWVLCLFGCLSLRESSHNDYLPIGRWPSMM